MCHGHRKRRRFSDIIASMVTAVLGDDVPDVSWLCNQCLIITTAGPNFDCKLISIACVVEAGYRNLITHLFDSQWSSSCQGHCRVVGQDTLFLLRLTSYPDQVPKLLWKPGEAVLLICTLYFLYITDDVVCCRMKKKITVLMKRQYMLIALSLWMERYDLMFTFTHVCSYETSTFSTEPWFSYLLWMLRQVQCGDPLSLSIIITFKVGCSRSFCSLVWWNDMAWCGQPYMRSNQVNTFFLTGAITDNWFSQPSKPAFTSTLTDQHTRSTNIRRIGRVKLSSIRLANWVGLGTY